MKPVELVLRVATSKTGAALDVLATEKLGHSPVSLLFARLTAAPYNQPLVLTTKGARTGLARKVVLPDFPAGGDDIAVVGSKGGAPTDPHWVHNLRKNPDAWVTKDRKRRAVRARIASGEEREALWQGITERAQVYLDYQKRAEGHREIPVVILSPH